MNHSPFERRRLEVFFAMMTAWFGLWLLRPVVTMDTPGLQHLVATVPEAGWGGLFLTNGLAHCAWLAVNGARWWSPLVRFWAAFGSACLYAIWSFGIFTYDPHGTGVYTYAALSAGSAACCVFAWRDSISAVRIHRVVTAQR